MAGKSNLAALQNHESIYRLLVDTNKDFAILVLDPDGHIATSNPGVERLKGYRADEIIGKHFSIFYPKEDVAHGKPEKELQAAAEKGAFEDEGWRVRKDGSRFWANVVITALRDKTGSLIGFSKLSRDLTERKQAQETIQKLAQEIMEISIPIMQVWDGVLVVPLIGTLDTARAQRLMEQLLRRIVETGSPIALLDVTGVPAIDTKSAQHLIETVSAVRLLGGNVILTGIRPAIAQTLVHLGIDLKTVITRPSLMSGLRHAMDLLNMAVTAKSSGS